MARTFLSPSLALDSFADHNNTGQPRTGNPVYASWINDQFEAGDNNIQHTGSPLTFRSQRFSVAFTVSMVSFVDAQWLSRS